MQAGFRSNYTGRSMNRDNPAAKLPNALTLSKSTDKEYFQYIAHWFCDDKVVENIISIREILLVQDIHTLHNGEASGGYLKETTITARTEGSLHNNIITNTLTAA